ncbi:MAG: MauE/DoxX family redox-associated membrane protein [Phycisphaerales bacterium JB040]
MVLRCLEIVAAGAAVVLALLGALKLVELNGFVSALGGWTLVPEAIKPVVAVIVPSAEVVTGLLWFSSRRRTAALAGVFLASCLAGLSVWQYSVAAPPDCGCIGPLVRYLDTQSTVTRLVVLNGSMIVAFGGWLVADRLWGQRCGSCVGSRDGVSAGGSATA